MRLDTLENCEACLRATRDHEAVTLSAGGRVLVSFRLCPACRSEAHDAIRREVRELRAKALRLTA